VRVQQDKTVDEIWSGVVVFSEMESACHEGGSDEAAAMIALFWSRSRQNGCSHPQMVGGQKLWRDSKDAIQYNPEFHAKAKHIQLSVHFQREKVEKGLVELIHVGTEEQAADGFTKPLSPAKFKR
jgi:hypothetical protein